jgi:hypothetical protein
LPEGGAPEENVMRLFHHLATGDGCEAPGCAITTCSLHRCPGGWIRACTRAHAEEADRHLLTEELARTIEAEHHLVEGEEVWLE